MYFIFYVGTIVESGTPYWTHGVGTLSIKQVYWPTADILACDVIQYDNEAINTDHSIVETVRDDIGL